MSYCRKCGAEIPDDAKFCQNCGNAVEQKTNLGLGVLGLFLMVLGLTTLFGVVGTVIGLVIAVVVLLINATQK